MKVFEVNPLPGTQAHLRVYLRSREYEFVTLDKRPMIVVIPGGGYGMTSDREADPIAMTFVKRGYQACILRYTCRARSEEPALGDKPLQEAAAAIRYVRTHAEEWGVDPDKITVCGFSAGGHLAASIGVHWNDPSRIPEAGEMCRPNAMILSYAVCLGNSLSHRGSIENLTGIPCECDQDMLYDTTRYVNEDTPPAFIWHTQEDDCVPVENALAMASAMQRAHRTYALHIFTHGWHGMSLATPEVVAGGPTEPRDWVDLAHKWLRSMGIGTEY